MYPIWDTVDQASTRLMSSFAQPMIAPIIRVNAPTATTTVCAARLAEKIGLDRAMRYTPAVTIVAAWIRAETGVGPSIASGNHACSGNWPDLPHAPSRSSRPSISTVVEPALPTAPNTSLKLTEPNAANIRNIAVSRPTSPTRFMMNAFLPAVVALGRSNQNAISRYDARPTPSQPMKVIR